MTEREKFEREFPLPERCEWSDALSQYCWVYTSAAHPHENFWYVWQAAIAKSQQVPEGMALVPVEPTENMIEAAVYHAMRETDDDSYRAIGLIRCVWADMLAAAKEPQCLN